MYYLLAILADIGITGTFSINKLYRQRVSGSVRSIAGKVAFGSLLSLVLFLCVNGFTLQLNGFTLLMAVCMNLVGIASEVVCFTAYAKGQISLFTVFQMQGGMLLPFLYGVMLGDALTLPRIAGILLMSAALVLTVSPNKGEKLSRGFIALCCAIFLLNGSISIISYIYSNGTQTLGPTNYIIIKSAMMFVIAVAVWGTMKLRNRSEKTPLKETAVRGGLLLGASVMDNASYFLQLIAAANLSSMVLYPVVTGGTVVLTALAGRLFFGERHSKRALLGFALSFVATLMFAL